MPGALRAIAGATTPKGRALLETYLDRRFAGWRQADEGQGEARRRNDRGGAMTRDQAYRDPGLAAGRGRRGNHSRAPVADEEASSRPWRLDRSGGAGQQAKDVLLRHGVNAPQSSRGETGEAALLERAAGGLGARRVEAGEAGAVEDVLSLGDFLGERPRLSELPVVLGARAGEQVVGLGGVVRDADLDDPAAMIGRRGRSLGGDRRGRLGRGRRSARRGRRRATGPSSTASGPLTQPSCSRRCGGDGGRRRPRCGGRDRGGGDRDDGLGGGRDGGGLRRDRRDDGLRRGGGRRVFRRVLVAFLDRTGGGTSGGAGMAPGGTRGWRARQAGGARPRRSSARCGRDPRLGRSGRRSALPCRRRAPRRCGRPSRPRPASGRRDAPRSAD